MNHKHGHITRLPNGKQRKSPTYQSWSSMNDRCYREGHPCYLNYGGKGIEVCERWRRGTVDAFQNFLDDMGLRPSSYYSLGREKNHLNYCKENCGWATEEEQANNRTTNRIVSFRGKRMTLMRAVKIAGVRRRYPAILRKIWRGVDPQFAIDMYAPAKRKAA